MKWNRKIALGILSTTLCFTGSLQADVIGQWNFDEKLPGNAADTTTDAILDQSGNAHHGAISDAGVLYVSGNTNYSGTSALRFTTGPDHISVPDASGVFNFLPSQSITLEVLIRTTNIGEDGIGSLLAKQGASPGEWWWRINANGTQQFFISDGTTTRSVSGSRKLNDGQWHHLAAVYDATAQQLRVYVDYVQDASAAAVYSSANIIGNAQNLWIAAFQAGNRQFDGDMDFARISSAALQPTEFLQPLTYITEVLPTNGASFLPSATTASFRVKSPTVGVAATNVYATINGVDISSQLLLSGTVNDWTATLPALTDNRYYQVEMRAIDQQGHQSTRTNTFNTFTQNLLFVEAEDYNFDGGQFIDNPQLSSSPGPNNYLDRLGVQGVDFQKTNPPTTTLYRIGDGIGTAVSTDIPRQQYIDAQASDPGIADYMTKDFVNGEWVNYTRTFPGVTYRVYARFAKGGTVPIVINVDEVTAGSTTTDQTLSPIGSFRSQPTGSTQSYAFVPLKDGLGRDVTLPLNGVRTLRFSMVSGITGMTANYFIFVPEGNTQVPFVAAASPSSGADNQVTNTPIQIIIRDADTQINTATVQLKVDGTTVAPTITPISTGAQINYTPTSLSIGLHTNTLIFSDNLGTSVTNIWQFRVANQTVRAQWTFNEKAAGNVVSTSSGAILDVSGNSRNGTANDPAMQYVSGSFNYGNTPALRFTSGFDRVVVPDSFGSFNFTNSFTWEAVLRTTSSAASLAILGKNGTGDGEGEYWWRLPGPSGGVQYVGMNDGTGSKFLAGTNILNDGNWHHIAVVYDTNTAQIRLYADYRLEGTLTNVLFTKTIGRPSDLYIGSFNGGGSEFDGDIDSIRVSNGALTTAQFLQTSVALAPAVKSYRPGTNAVHVFPTPLIRLDLLNRDTQVVPASFRMFVDGNEVTAGTTSLSDTNGAFIKYQPSSPLADGVHTVVVTYYDTAVPANYATNQWQFTVVNNEPVVGLYQLNEKAPGNTADTTTNAIVDSSGNARHGTASQAVPYVSGATNYGGTSALEFTVALGAHVAVPDPTGAFNFSPTKSITLEAVIKTTNIGQSSVGAILAKQLAATPEWWWRINSTGFQQFNVNDSTAAKSVTGTKKLNDGQWHHVAAVYDAALKQLRVYVDYVQDGSSVTTTYSSTNTIIGNSQDLWIGAFQAGNRLFDGDIDVVRVTAAPLDVSWFIPLGGIASQAKILNPVVAANSISFSFTTDTTHSYVIQSTDALGGTWNNLQTITGDGTTKTVNYSTTGQQQFFRISVQ